MKRTANVFPWRISTLLFFAGIALIWPACEKDTPSPPDDGETDLTHIPYNPQPYAIVKPAHFPQVPIPPDNQPTVEGVQLGRRLFYDPMLSADSTQSCSSCHLPQGSFTDNMATSKGIDGLFGRRSSMSLLNIAYATNRLFWDGRSPNLEDQALRPVEDPIEMHNSWPNVVAKLKKHPDYPARFRKAFGINSTKGITKELAAKAIAQFERSLISSGNSKFDRYLAGDLDALDDEELDGKLMFFDEGQVIGLPDAQCFHCHGGITLTGNQYFNNGLDSVGSLDEFVDKGLGEVTGNPSNNGQFRAPTLRNIAMTAPYMHDGRFQTLEQVIEHYSSHGKPAPNRDPLIPTVGFPIPGTNPVKYSGLTTYQKQALLKFLHTLTDPDFVENPNVQSPF